VTYNNKQVSKAFRQNMPKNGLFWE